MKTSGNLTGDGLSTKSTNSPIRRKTTSPPPTQDDNSTNVIIGATIGGIVLLALIVVLFLFLVKRKRRYSNRAQPSGSHNGTLEIPFNGSIESGQHNPGLDASVQGW